MNMNRDSADPNCVLWEWGTYAETQRMKDLVAGRIEPTKEDLGLLWDMYAEGGGMVGSEPTLPDFGMWLSGVLVIEDQILECKPAEISW